MKPNPIELTPEEIYEFNLWLFDHPQYQRMSWREQVMFWRALTQEDKVA